MKTKAWLLVFFSITVALSSLGMEASKGHDEVKEPFFAPLLEFELPTCLGADVPFCLFNSDGSMLFTVSNYWRSTARSYLVNLWNSKNGELIYNFEHSARIVCACFFPDNKKILTASEDNKAIVWSLENGQKKSTFDHDLLTNATTTPGL